MYMVAGVLKIRCACVFIFFLGGVPIISITVYQGLH